MYYLAVFYTVLVISTIVGEFTMSRTLIWVLTWSVLGPVPESGEQAKFKTQAECEQARTQKREEYQVQKKRIVATCHQSTKG
jgi:hypothetical protein